jgi:uncharacterized protein involved in outer membrane biogenesis
MPISCARQDRRHGGRESTAMAASWRWRRWLRIAGIAMVLLTAGAAATPFLIPVDRYKSALQQFVRSSTGWDVEIGSLRLWLWPSIHVHAANVRLLNPPGFPRGNALTVQSIDLGVDARALLRRQLQITSIALDGVRVNVVADAAGRTNIAAPAQPRVRPTAGSTARGLPLLTLGPIGAVRVTHIVLTLAESNAGHAQAAPLVTATGMSATLSAIDPAARDWATRLRIAANLRGAQLTTPLLASPVEFGAGWFLVTGGRGQGTFAAALDGTRASGTIAISGPGPSVMAFTAAIPVLDIDQMLRVVGPRRGSSTQASGPRRLLARGTVEVGRLIVAPLEAARVHTRLRVYTDSVHADSYSLSAYGGTAQGTAVCGYAAARAPVTATAHVRGVDLAAVVAAVTRRTPLITGTLDGDLGIATALGEDPEAALTGAGTFAVRNGSFPGLDLRHNLAQVASALGLNVPAGLTRFRYLRGDLRIAHERAYSTVLRLDAQGLEAVGGGSFGFDGTLDYTGTGVLTSLGSAATSGTNVLSTAEQVLARLAPGAAGVTGARVPFSITGPLGAPRVALAGTPALIRGGVAPQPGQPSLPRSPSLQQLLKFLH